MGDEMDLSLIHILRMIADAQRGMFDFIITKEISRFSRNTLDSIQYTQELLENNVGVLFQNCLLYTSRCV